MYNIKNKNIMDSQYKILMLCVLTIAILVNGLICSNVGRKISLIVEIIADRVKTT